MKVTLAAFAFVVALALTMPITALADAADKPSISTTQKVTVTAIVEAIDLDKKEVTLRGPQGNSRTIQLGDEAPRLHEVVVGDTVLAEYLQNLTVEVMANPGAEPGGGVISAMGRAPDEEAPGVVVADTIINTATVEEINLENNTFKLNWGEGNIEEYEARDPANLRKAEVGDLVVVAYTEALALSVQEVIAE